MKDKEIDQLFKDRLGDAEIEPSINLWNNIAEGLKPRKKKSFSEYWIAAAIAVIIGFMLLISPKEEKIRLQGNASLVNNHDLSTTTQSTIPIDSKREHKNDMSTHESTPLVIAPRLKEVSSKDQFIVKRSVVAKTFALNTESDHINVESKPDDDIDYVHTDNVIAKGELSDENDANLILENEASTKGIRNVGDFVNYVVSKVDKREDKFLKFKTDDDNSSLVGINIGFIKLNLKRNK